MRTLVIRHPARPVRSALRLVAGCAILLLTIGCGGDDTARRSFDPGSSATAAEGSEGGAYTMPAGWPIATFPLPPGGSAQAPHTTEDMVYFPVSGVDTEAALDVHATRLPEAGFPDTDNANLAIRRYEGKDLKILVQDDGRGVALVTITRGGDSMQIG